MVDIALVPATTFGSEATDLSKANRAPRERHHTIGALQLLLLLLLQLLPLQLLRGRFWGVKSAFECEIDFWGVKSTLVCEIDFEM